MTFVSPSLCHRQDNHGAGHEQSGGNGKLDQLKALLRAGIKRRRYLKSDLSYLHGLLFELFYCLQLRCMLVLTMQTCFMAVLCAKVLFHRCVRPWLLECLLSLYKLSPRDYKPAVSCETALKKSGEETTANGLQCCLMWIINIWLWRFKNGSDFKNHGWVQIKSPWVSWSN